MFYKLLPNYYPDKEDGMITIPVKQLNLDQVLEVFKWYFNSNLPNTKDMFPWLHGFHKYNFAQRSFFYINNNNYNKNWITVVLVLVIPISRFYES